MTSRRSSTEPWRPARFAVDGITKRQVKSGTRYDVRVRVDGLERRVVCRGQQQARSRRRELERAFADGWLWSDEQKGFVEPRRAATEAEAAQRTFLDAAAELVADEAPSLAPMTRANLASALSHAAVRLCHPPLPEERIPEASALLRRHVLAVSPEPMDAQATRAAVQLVRARSLPLADIDRSALRPVVQDYSPRQAQAANRLLRIVGRILAAAGLEDPTPQLRRRDRRDSEVDVGQVLTQEHVWAIADAAEALRETAGGTHQVPAIRVGVLLMGVAGLRLGEVAALRRADVQTRDERWWVVVRATQQAAPAWAFVDGDDRERSSAPKSKAAGATRWVPLPQPVGDEVEAHLSTHTPPAASAPLIPQPSGRNAGQAVRRQTLAKWYRRALDEAVSEAEREHLDVRPHGLRHAAITHWLRAGVPPTTARKWSGHSSTRVLMDVYWRALPGDDEWAVSQLDHDYSRSSRF